MANELTTQPTLSPEVFGRFINLKVGLSLSGSASYDLAELEKVLAGEQLQKGSELIITARYFVADVHMPVSRRGGYGSSGDTYELGNAKLDVKLIKVESVDVKAAKLHQCQVMKCECLVENAPNTEKPAGYKLASAPLQSFWANSQCQECHGKGYVHPRKNKAPLAQRVYGNGVLVLVDEFPELPDVPEDACPQCGEIKWHVQGCPVKAEEEAAAKKAKQGAKKAYKEAAGKAAPSCYTEYGPYAYRCKECEAKELCAKAGGYEGTETEYEGEPADEKPGCYGTGDCQQEACEFEDECLSGIDDQDTDAA
jgi:hypothetical protein